MAEDSIHPFDEIIEAGIDFTTVVALRPTFVCERDNAIELDVLDPAPDFADVRHAMNMWVATKTPRNSCDRGVPKAFIKSQSNNQPRSTTELAAFASHRDG